MLTAIREMAEEAEHGGDWPRSSRAATRLRRAHAGDAADPDRGGRRRRGRRGPRRDRARDRGRAHGGRTPAPPAEVDGQLGFEAIHQELSRYRYCTVFVVEGEALDTDELEAELEQLGDSLLVVGDPPRSRCTSTPTTRARALSLGTARGTIGGVEIADMHAQTREREERLLHAVPDAEPAASAIVVVTAGAGNRALERASARSSSTAARR